MEYGLVSRQLITFMSVTVHLVYSWKLFVTSQPLAKAPQKAEDFDWSQPLGTGAAAEKADAFDWSQPLTTSAPKNKADNFDWSQPLASTAAPKSDSFDWSQPAQSGPHVENTNGSKQLEEGK